jgi:CubicO group peptidase (beta-lactamase class C family)
LLYGGRGFGQVTGTAVPKLVVFDELMGEFMREHKPPGAALAVSFHGRLVYARGFGYADVEAKELVRPDSLFRIASLSKPFTAVGVLRLVEKGKLKLDDRVLPILKLEPYLEPGTGMDPRWHDITVLHCLQHTGGWDRGKSFDPMGARTAEDVARALGVRLPIDAKQIIRFTMGKPLDSDPGTAYAYSNFGYCVLGRVIEAVSGRAYPEYMVQEVLAPLGIRRMRLGKNLLKDRAPGEVKYYDGEKRTGRAISGPEIGKRAPLPYGVECIETMDANGGWIASAMDLVRFAAALDDPKRCPLLSEASIQALLAPPAGAVGHGADGKPKPEYYACGWNVRSAVRRPGKYAKSHSGLLAGSSTMLVCREDSIDWAAVFNCDADKDGKQYAALIRPLVNRAVGEIKEWPARDLWRDL